MCNNSVNHRALQDTPEAGPPSYEQAVIAAVQPPAAPRRRRGEGALTEDMKQRLKLKYIPEFENLVLKHDENFKKSSDEVKAWKKAKSSEILTLASDGQAPFDNITSGLHEDDEHKQTDLKVSICLALTISHS